ncbi:hypothetical protein PENSPDRAFT_319014 [Peniophora sp. CONT]|nr:hypothetical protein PENSPDRAFT_319014 [Peniophora sp. CONT]
MTNATISAAAASASSKTSNVTAPSVLERTQSGNERERDVTRQGFENHEERGGGEADANYVDHAYMHKVASEQPNVQNKSTAGDLSTRAREYKHST